MTDKYPWHGSAERLYDFMVLCGLDPVPWQYELLVKIERQIERHSINDRFLDILKENQLDD